MQKLTIAGAVGKDSELRRTGSGDAVLSFSLAVDNGKDANGNKRDATWFDASIWGKRAEKLEAHIKKATGTCQEIADAYDISPSAVSMIKRNLRRKHVGE